MISPAAIQCMRVAAHGAPIEYNFFVSLYRADMHLKSIYVNATFEEKKMRTRNCEYFFI